MTTPADPAAGHDPTDHLVGEHFEDVEALEHLAEREGLASVKVAAELIEDELRAKSPLRRFLEIAISIVITVVIFVRVIPQLLNVEYADVWQRMTMIDKPYVAFLFAFWLFTMWSYAGVLSASLPGLTRLQAMVVNFSGSALANVIPFGGAAGVGATYAQSMSWGFDPPSITLSIIVTGVWNIFAKLGMPILVLGALLLTGQSSQGLGVAGVIGFGILVVAIGLLVAVFESEGLAMAIGARVQAMADGVRRVLRRPAGGDFAARIHEFRQRTVGLVKRRWTRLTLWMVLYKASQAFLQLLCARAVGLEGVGWIQIFAVYTFGELLSTIPVTPSGLGFVEGGSTQLLIAFGGQADAALAAVLFYRAFTYVLEIPLGAAGWLTWSTRHSWRRPPNSMRAAA